MRTYILVIILLICSTSIFSQESKSKINHEGKEFTQLKHAWYAQWITHPTESTLDYGVFLYRREFKLKIIPEKYIIHVSADNKYKLYINGIYVCEGPSRGDINNWRYETVDISKFMQLGNNVIAAEVVNFGEFRHGAQQTFQTAFILQSELGVEPSIHTGKKSGWKIIKNKAYNFIPFVSDSVGGYYVAGPGDEVDASKYPWGWNEINYDDTDWKTPRSATVEFAVGRGFLFGSTWYLVPREIPFMKKEISRFKSIVRTNLKDIGKDFIHKRQSLIIPPHSEVSILFDHKTHTVGFPELVLSKGHNARIKITYGEALFKKGSKKRTAHKGWEKGYRNDLKNQEIRGYYDIYLPYGGDNRKYTPLSLRTFRFVQFDITTKDDPLIIKDYYNIVTTYPFEEKASFNVEDEKLTQIWDVAWRTLQNSSQDVFLDPYYEQLQYVGDARIESLVSIYVSGDDRLMRKAIKQFDDSRLSLGLTQSRFPSYIVQVIPTYSLLWIDMMHDYYMYRDDPDFLKQFVPGMRTVLDWFKYKIDNTGMLANLEWWNFTDWTSGFQNGIPPGADDGHSANVSLQYVYALQNAAELFDYFGLEKEALEYKRLAKTVQSAVMNNCFDENKGLIAERPEKDVYSQHTNIFAILTDTYSNELQGEVMGKILSDKSLIQTSIYFKFYLVRALQKTGRANKYLNMLKPWQYMIDQGMTTFGETEKNPRSECHGWSSTPCFEFLHTVAGIYPGEAGFKTVIFEPNPGRLKSFNGEFPHPKGIIEYDYKFKNNKCIAIIKLPKGIKGILKWNGKEVTIKEGKNKIELN